MPRSVAVAAWLLMFLAGFSLCRLVAAPTGLRAKYFTNQTRSGPPVAEAIDRDISTATVDNGTAAHWAAFSAEWSGFIAIDRPGLYTFATTSDDGSELEVNDVVVVRNGGDHGAQQATGQAELLAGIYPVRVRYHQAGGASFLRLYWGLGDWALVPIPAAHLLPDPVSYRTYRMRPYVPFAGGAAALLLWIVGLHVAQRRLAPVRASTTMTALGRWTVAIAQPHQAVVVLVVIGFAVRAWMMLGSTGILWPDSDVFLITASAILDGRFLEHDIYRTLLYPYFLACFLYWGNTAAIGTAIVAAQHALGIASTVLFYDAGRRVFTPLVALVAALLLSIHTMMLFYETSVLSEILFVFVLSLLVACAVRTIEHPSLARAAVVGALCATLTLVRPVGAWFVLATVPIWWMAFSSARKRAAAIAVVIGAFACLMLPWMSANQRQYGFFGINAGKGLGLFIRVFEIERFEPDPTVYPFVKDLYESVPARHLSNLVHDRLQREHRLSGAQIDAAMFDMAMSAAAAHPGPFLLNSLRQWVVQLGGTLSGARTCASAAGRYLCSGRTEGYSLPAFPNAPRDGYPAARAWLVAYFAHGFVRMPIVLALSLLGLVAYFADSRRPKAAGFLLSMTIGYFTLVPAVSQWPQDRFRLPVDGLLFMFAAWGLRALAQLASGSDGAVT